MLIKYQVDKYNSLKNKTVLITCTSRGIGKELCLAFLKNGASVIGLSSGKTKKISIKNKRYDHIFCDLEKNDEIKKIFFKLKKYKKIDVIINNAGVTLEETTDIDKNLNNFKKVIQTNLISAYVLTSVLLKKKKKIKKIINISSIGGILGFPQNPSYQSSKAGIIGLTKSIARDFGKEGLNYNAVLPGYFKTKMNKKSYDNYSKRKKEIRFDNTW